MLQSLNLWLPLQLPTGLGYLVKRAANTLVTARDFENSLERSFLLAVCQTSLNKGDAKVLESVGDLLANNLFNLDYPSQVMQELIPYISGIYGKCLKIASENRKQSLMIKFFAMAAIHTEMNFYLNLDQEHEQLEEAEKFANAAINCLCDSTLLPESEIASSQEIDSWMTSSQEIDSWTISSQKIASWIIHVFPSMKSEGEFIAQKDYFLAYFLYEWMNKKILKQWEFLKYIEDASVQAKNIYLQKSACLERCSIFWKVAKVPYGQLAMLEKISFLHSFKLQNIELGRKFADEALKLGDDLNFDLQMAKAPSETIVNLRQRLYSLSRLTGDQKKVEQRLDLFCAHLHRDADKYYEKQEWNKAANFYSNLGYKYFNAAEYVGSRVLYNLSIYFFEKAEYCRSKEPYILQENPDDMDTMSYRRLEMSYRRLEANGFIYGASARLSNKGPAVVGLFYDAADQLAEAAFLTFQNLQIHDFYNSTAHFFLAQAELARAAKATGSQDFIRHIISSDQALGECFPLYKNIFNAYQSILKILVNPNNQEKDEDKIRYLSRGGHPDPRHVVDIAHRIISHYETGNSCQLSDDLFELGRCFIYLNPLG